MRIIAGRHRGRRIAAPAGRAVRPTAERAREALFDMLAHGGLAAGGGAVLEDARVLDAFAGSGALGLEALSRGAAHASFMDRDPAALKAARANVEALGERGRATLYLADAAEPPEAEAPADIVLMDPPYGSGLAAPALAALAARGWIARGTLAVVELPARGAPFDPPPGFAAVRERRYGAARLVFLSFSG